VCAGARAYVRERARGNEAKNKKSTSVMSRKCSLACISRRSGTRQNFCFLQKKKDRQAQVFFVFGRMKLCDGSTTQKKRQHVMSFLIFFCLFFGVPASARSSHLATKKI
jgi:hypothetical protein